MQRFVSYRVNRGKISAAMLKKYTVVATADSNRNRNGVSARVAADDVGHHRQSHKVFDLGHPSAALARNAASGR